MALSQKFIDGLFSENDPGSTHIELFRLYYSPISEPSSFFPFCCSSLGYGGGVTWQGVEYQPLPAEFEGIELSSERLSRPKLRIANDSLIISQILRKKNDLKDARISRVRTQLKFLDDVNFDGGENPFGAPDPSQEIVDSFVISQKISENRLLVEFECTAPFDLSDYTIPARNVSPQYCQWQYRGCGCNYWGPPVEKADGTPFSAAPTGIFNFQSNESEWKYGFNYSSGDVSFLSFPKDPFRTYYVSRTNHVSSELNSPSVSPENWDKDDCSKNMFGCAKRHLLTGISYTGNVTIPNPLSFGVSDSEKFMPFGGYPATDRYARS